jgi:hypothetical protein
MASDIIRYKDNPINTDPFYRCQRLLGVAAKYYSDSYLVKEGIQKEGIIYIVSAKRMVKIGFTEERSFDNRMRALQTGCPLKLDILMYEDGSLQAEKAIHKAFKSLSISGEWYNNKNEIRELIWFIKVYGLTQILSGWNSNEKLIPRPGCSIPPAKK